MARGRGQGNRILQSQHPRKEAIIKRSAESLYVEAPFARFLAQEIEGHMCCFLTS
jgi:hypothetical protein